MCFDIELLIHIKVSHGNGFKIIKLFNSIENDFSFVGIDLKTYYDIE